MSKKLNYNEEVCRFSTVSTKVGTEIFSRCWGVGGANRSFENCQKFLSKFFLVDPNGFLEFFQFFLYIIKILCYQNIFLKKNFFGNF